LTCFRPSTSTISSRLAPASHQVPGLLGQEQEPPAVGDPGELVGEREAVQLLLSLEERQ
jgi:hypothetical protein